MKVKQAIKSCARMFGFDIVRYPGQETKPEPVVPPAFPKDFNEEEITLIRDVLPYTMTVPERIHALSQAVKYISKHNIEGDIVECGVWRGGSMMAVARTLVSLNDCRRNLYLFDTFSGMTEPSDKDVDYMGNRAAALLQNDTVKEHDTSIWCYATIETVREVMLKTGYDPDKLHFIQGKVEETIPGNAPERISLLRLDTDWYESTRHELIHLFPRLSRNGVIIIDDYGHWEGAKRAVDEYFSENNVNILLNRIDYSARIAVKTEGL